MESNIKWLVAAGHEMASELKAECGAVDMRSVAKLISDLATQLEVQLVRANALAEDQQKAIESIKQADSAVKLAHEKFSALVAENAGLKHAMAVTLEHVSVTDAGQAGVAAMIINDALHHSETPATDAFLAEIRADEPRRLKPKPGVRYLAELSDFDKSDVIRWWRKQPFDLQIPEHLGNCVFCIKKSTQKLGLACKDEPGLMRIFNELVTGKHVRDGHRRTGKDVMYRGHLTLDGIARMYADSDYRNLYQAMVQAKRFDTGSCSESCEIWGDQLELRFEEVVA
ncbi:hypothetical protein ID528_002139 [Escherichia coli]|nr:hypothetical protein [Escherichia coli]